jgi:CRISPR-associated exonuclease Cas4
MSLPILLGLLVVLLLLAALAFWWSRRKQEQTGLPAGEVVYADTGVWKKPEKPLYAERLRLTGKPDYIVEEGGRYIPVEVKPTRRAEQPYPADEYQLAAYCLLLEEQRDQRGALVYGAPPYGLLRYASKTFRIPYTPELREGLLRLLDEMRQSRRAPDVAPNHQDARRCLRCGHRAQCTRKLA